MMNYPKQILVKAFNYTIPALFLFPLFKESISTFLLLILVLNTTLYAFFYGAFDKKTIKKTFVFTIPFWIVFLFSWVHFDGLNSLYPINNVLFFLLFPVVFAVLPNDFFSTQKINVYFNILKICCVIISCGFVILFFQHYSIYDFFVVHNGVPRFRDFVYNEIPFFKIHPTYFASIVFFCITFSLENLFLKRKYIEVIYLILFIIIIFLLVVKITILCVFILFVIFFFFRSGVSWKLKTGFIGLCLPLIYILIHYTPGLEERIYEMITSVKKPANEQAYDSTNIRVAISNCDLQIIKEHYLMGSGFSSIERSVETCLAENYSVDLPEDKKYMTHNYYFYILMGSGLLGFLFYMLYLYKILTFTFKAHRFILYAFVTYIFVVCLTEDFFYRSYGLFFFCLVFFTFFKNKEYIDKNLSKEK